MTSAPVRRGVARRTELLDALVALLLAEGFASFTLDDLAARLHCSKRTLYSIAGSKEQLVRTAVVHFFRGATAAVEDAVAREPDPAARITVYLQAVAVALRPASAAILDDVASFPPAAEIYERNTRAAARRIREFIDEGVAAGAFRATHTGFVADVVASTMVRIQQRQVAAATGLSDAEAYAELAALVTNGLAAP
ncbi:TetR/AcrR family transcriptional regulator [Cryptosporangium phraense]|uniref:TetR/AcrR family transcriptional regulator n=1 Tax=Cryptosporangium phraense TaxID=2593070 RepID=A0A545AX98_9ACTN|nr:TetR/AcrR family transcriptional regulator [Cryptosporangium phraense]TQS45950.1 TetR/AcrR family transcriptional regulator [Cryptosporangium phraense]